MKILIFGNVGSGKTTLLKKLKSTYSFEVISIDDYRRRIGDGTIEKEALAKEQFLTSVLENKNQFIECLGIGMVADKLFELLYLSGEIIICVILVTSRNTCFSRLTYRNWDIPFPFSLDQVNSLVNRIDIKITGFEIENLWNKRANTIILRRNNESEYDLEYIYTETINLIHQSLQF